MRIFGILLIIILNSVASFSQTEVSGRVSGTWNKAGSPYYLTGDAYVHPVDKLTIEPGTRILATGHYELKIQGQFNAIGTAADSIIFTHKDATLGEQWKGLVIRYHGTPGEMSYCKIMNAGNITKPESSDYDPAVRIGSFSGTFRISNSEISNCHSHKGAIVYNLDAHTIISNTLFTNNSTNDEYLGPFTINNSGSWFVQISNCVFSNNRASNGVSDGIFINNGNVLLDRCLFRAAEGAGGDQQPLLKIRESVSPILVNNCVFDVSPSTQYDPEPEKTAINITGGSLRLFNTIAANGKIEVASENINENIAAYYCCLVSPINGVRNFQADPQFLDPVNSDYRLSQNSACKDSGNPIALYYDEDDSRNDLGIFGGTGKVVNEKIVDLGAVKENKQVIKDIIFFNTSPAAYRVNYIKIDNPEFFTMIEPESPVVNSFSKLIFKIACKPTEKRSLANRVHFEFDNVDISESFDIPVKGWMGHYYGEVHGTWTQAESPIILTDDVTIPKGKELKIEPGVKILAKSDDGNPILFRIEGSLFARGTETDSIIFTSYYNDLPEHKWAGIQAFYDDEAVSPQYLKLAYCKITNSTNGIFASLPVVEINNCTFEKTEGYCFDWRAPESSSNNTVVVESSWFNASHEENSAIYIDGGGYLNTADSLQTSVYIKKNTFEKNSNGIVFSNSASLHSDEGNPHNAYITGEISNNVFIENANGITLASSLESALPNSTTQFEASISNNVFSINQWATTIVFDATQAFELYSGNHPIVANIVNNTYFASGRTSIRLLHPTSTVNCKNNIIWYSYHGTIDSTQFGEMTFSYNNSSTLLPGEGNISSAPELVDVWNNDFRLRPASPCIDAGDPASPANPDGSPADIGARYYPQYLPAFSLLEPATGVVLNEQPESFTWQAANMATGTQPYYLYQLSSSAEFQPGTIVQQDTTHKTNFESLATLQEGTTYYWRVTAFTPWDKSREANEVFSFRLRSPSDPPGILSNSIAPQVVMDNYTGGVTFSFNLVDSITSDESPELFLKLPGANWSDAHSMSAKEQSDSSMQSYSYVLSPTDEWTWNDYRGDTLYYKISYENRDGETQTTEERPIPVIDENDPPQFEFDQKVFLVTTEDQKLELDISEYLSDEESEFEDIEIKAEPDRFTFEAALSGSVLRISWGDGYQGEGMIYLQATDPDGASSKDTIHIAVSVPSDIEEQEALPTEYTLHQNYPNPFNPTTTIAYELPEESSVLLELYSMQGERVMVLRDQVQSAGYHNAHINGAGLASGIYLYRLIATGSTSGKTKQFIRKMMLLK